MMKRFNGDGNDVVSRKQYRTEDPPLNESRNAPDSSTLSCDKQSARKSQGTRGDATAPENLEPAEKASFALSGALAKDKRTGNVVKVQITSGEAFVSKYAPPVDACEPSGDWRIFVFKGDDCLETLYLHRKSHFVFGRDEELADVVIAHPSCSKEHAVLQYRKSGAGGSPRLYLIDLESTNGTKLNFSRIVPAHFVEVKDGDVLSFGDSSREYVLKLAEEKKN